MGGDSGGRQVKYSSCISWLEDSPGMR
jgi:hypothetical protein